MDQVHGTDDIDSTPAHDASPPGAPAAEAAAAQVPATGTGDSAEPADPVAVATARLAGIGECPLDEHPAVYGEIHTALHDALASIDDA